MSRLERYKAALRSEGGYSLPETLVSVLVNAACIAVIAGSLVTFAVVQQNTAFRTAATNDSAVIESHWRSAGLAATAVDVDSDAGVTFTRPSLDREACTRMVFTLTPVGSTQELTITRQSFAGLPNSESGRCDGVATASRVLASTTDAGGDAAFTFTTAAGRPTTFTDGVQSLSATSRPSGVSAAAWESTALGAAMIDTRLGSLNSAGHTASVTQIISGLVQAAAPDTVSRYVTE